MARGRANTGTYMYSHGVVDPMPRHPGALNPEGPITLCTRLAAEALCSRTASCAIPSGSRAARACPRTARPRKSAVQAERRRAGAPRPRVTCRGSWRAQPARARPPAPRAPAARPAAGRRRPAGGPGAARAPRARARSAARPPGAHAAGARSAGARRSEEEGAPDCSLLLDAVCRGSRQALYWHHTDGDTAAQRPGFQELQRQSDQHGGRMAGGRTRGAGHFRGTTHNA